jgi:hypothetical protein
MPVVTRARRAFERRSVVIDVEELVPGCSVNNLRSPAEATLSVVPAVNVEEAAYHLRDPPEISPAIMLIRQVAPALERRTGRTGSVVMDVEEAPPPFYRLRTAAYHLRDPPEISPAIMLIRQVAPALERRTGRTGSVVMDVEEAPPPFYRLRTSTAEVAPAMRLPPAQ